MLSGKDTSHRRVHKIHNPFMRIATVQDAKQLATILREDDIAECKAHSNIGPEEALVVGVQLSHLPIGIFLNDNHCIAIVGVVPETKKVGRIWLLASDDLKLNLSYRFLKHCHKVCDLLNKSFPVLYNHVDARNDLHIKWLKWMKFTFINKVNDFGYEKRPFYEFIKICAHQH